MSTADEKREVKALNKRLESQGKKSRYIDSHPELNWRDVESAATREAREGEEARDEAKRAGVPRWGDGTERGPTLREIARGHRREAQVRQLLANRGLL